MNRIERTLKVLYFVLFSLTCLGTAVIVEAAYLSGSFVSQCNPYFLGIGIVSALGAFFGVKAALIAAYRR